MNNRDDLIEVLPAVLVEKIAAGEVIERPSSVVKELVENALDAGATRISIAIEDGGFALIRIADNGRGMSPENLSRSVLRHATSKIRKLEDLYSLSTMGFRGEALASVAAVSRTDILSSSTTDGLGHRLHIEGSIASPLEPLACGRGTTIDVRDLFYNTPARKKFMKSARAERMAITHVLEELIIPFCNVHFSLTLDAKTAFDVPSVPDLRSRIAQIAGTEFGASLVECTGSFDNMDLTAFVTRPQQSQQRPRYQSLFVNLRRIDSDSVTFAVRNAFRGFMKTDVKPAFFCFLSVDPERIDVNVHPTKQKIKFDDERRIFSGVYSIVSNSLSTALDPSAEIAAMALPTPGEPSFAAEFRASSAPFADRPAAFAKPAENGLPSALPGVSDAPQSPPADEQIRLTFTRPGGGPQKSLEKQGDTGVQLAGTVQPESWDLISCVQIHDLFILVPIRNGILLIDQHAAHERILFEQALDNLERGSAASQQLLFPITLDLSLTEKTVAATNLEHFAKFGYEISELSGNTIAVSAIPVFVTVAQVREAIRDMINYVLEEQSVRFFPQPHMRFAAAFACGNAIKSGQRLSQEEMNALLNNLFAAKNPYACPHGRPTLIRISVDEFKRRFLR